MRAPTTQTTLHASAVEEAALLRDHPSRAIVTKLGADGACWDDVRVPAEPVGVVDTTGAGDAFCGALAGEWSRTSAVQEDLRGRGVETTEPIMG